MPEKIEEAMLPCPLTNILFLDIETVPQTATYEELSEPEKKFWDRKSEIIQRSKEAVSPPEIYERAGIYAEFGKIICISVGLIQVQGQERTLCIKSFSGHDERTILFQFTSMLNRWVVDDARYICAHNGKEFDFPYISRRLLINDLPLPSILNVFGKKPWEHRFLDTMEMWKFGDYKNFTSLELLAHSFKIPTPKDDINGSMVHSVYWQENQVERVKDYCQKDVKTLVQVFLRLNGEPLITDANIEIK